MSATVNQTSMSWLLLYVKGMGCHLEEAMQRHLFDSDVIFAVLQLSRGF